MINYLNELTNCYVEISQNSTNLLQKIMDKMKGVYTYCKYLDARNQNIKGADVFCSVLLKDFLALYEYEWDCYLGDYPEDLLKATIYCKIMCNKLSDIYLYGCNNTFTKPPILYRFGDRNYDSNTLCEAAEAFIDVVKYTVKELTK